MKGKMILALAACTVGVAGCASQYKQEAKQEQQAKTMPINCATAEGDIRMLQSEQVSAKQQAAAGASAIVPIGALAGFATGTEGTKAQIANGDYNRVLQEQIDKIKVTCHL
jgi:hypothetical protein